ncbi:hypothetical protein IEN85_14645 [Pelagicoccus sp. NFK12]|uniref:Uncharacterized protein n=1 Tax=Pelagicoccus enzymogenes TaxID=2773457 RepID=A0A927IHZ7_9BACT|nr:hypothetical protein [Pelagicoccus enzymogenes]MBD5780736.1 hypothetical protein [Pelagicoccus enzymogenes]MDQ8200100.1 hypothetical protein [Pelagicoccus enzymogenes]
MKDRQSILSNIMDAVGLSPRKKLAPSAGRYLGMGGTFGRAHIRHCSTWDFEYKLPRVAARKPNSDFGNR